MTAPTAIAPLTCPPSWSVLAAGQAVAGRRVAPPRTRSLRIPLVAGDEWFWELVREVEVEAHAEAQRTDDRAAWGLVLLPAALVVQVALAYLLHVTVPGVVLVVELLVGFVLVARLDASRLRAQQLEAPSARAAVIPPLYLFRRAQLTQDLRMPLAWFAAAAAATCAYVLVDGRLAPVALPSDAVESVLYEQLFEGQLPLDAETGTITCPGFSSRWVGQNFRCTGQDTSHSVPLEVSVLDHSGALTWQALEPAS